MVPDSFLRQNKIRKSCCIQLFPQSSHVDGKGVLIHKAVAFPQLRHQRIAGHDLLLVLHQHLQYLKFVFR